MQIVRRLSGALSLACGFWLEGANHGSALRVFAGSMLVLLGIWLLLDWRWKSK
jgi:hypothetical protein